MTRIYPFIALPSEGLALMRRGLGLWCLVDCLLRLTDAQFFLSDLGVLSRSQYYTNLEGTFAFSLYLLTGLPQLITLMLLVTAALGLIHGLGRGSRLSRILLWLLILSVQNRHPMILDSSDDLVRLLLFWDIFLPDTKLEQSKDHVTPATVGLQFQLSLCLIFTGLAMNYERFWLSSQWQSTDMATQFFDLYGAERILLWLLVLAVWVRPLRLPLLCLTAPVLVAHAVMFHPIFPLTLVAGLLVLLARPRRDVDVEVSWFPSGLGSLGLIALCMVSLASNLVPQALRLPGEALGLHQDWSRIYPLPTEQKVQIVARDSSSGEVVWAVTDLADRRARLYADAVARQQAWAALLPKALGELYPSASGHLEIWMRAEALDSEFSLGSARVKLLSSTPVHFRTEGKAP